MSSPTIEEFERRLSTFLEVFTEEETDTFARSLVTVGDMVEVGFGADKAAQIMSALEQIITSVTQPDNLKLSADAGWRERFLDINVAADTPFPLTLQRAQDLNAFAYFGILASWNGIKDGQTAPGLEDTLVDVPSYIEDTIAILDRFISLFGKGAETWGFSVIERTMLAARARLKIDQDEPMTVHELAAISQVVTKRLQNAMYAKSDEAPITNKDGLITPASAHRWLEARQYLPSLWQSFIANRAWEHNLGDQASAQAPCEFIKTNDFLFVPEAVDGSVFGPESCYHGSDGVKHYTIGEKQAERTFDNYDDALSALTGMVTPRWRRPNNRGNFGIVRAERWRRVSRAELASL